MLYLEVDGTIKLTRGDTARFTVPIDIEDERGNVIGEYVMNSEDVLVFGVKKNVKDEEYCFRKEFVGTNDIHIEPSDTKDLAFGKYKYDIQLNKYNGDIFTITDTCVFEVLTEVS